MDTRASRRQFLATSAAVAAAGLTPLRAAAQGKAPLYKISLAEWSINQPLKKGTMQHLDFAKIAKSTGIDAIEYVNQFFMDKATDASYLAEMNTRARGEGVTQVLIMCDNEGSLGDPDAAKRQTAVTNHHKWVTAAKTLGCHSIRVNAYSAGTPEEQGKLVADGLHKLCEFADQHGLNVIIENHGGMSSNAKWLMSTIKQADHKRAGTLPDFGNFGISRPTERNPTAKLESYDSYVGVQEMMPLAKGVSVKPTVWDFHGKNGPIDLPKMMKIVVDAGYHGYCGIEHGAPGKELESIRELREQLEAARTQLSRS
ncbi:MAG TPA: sugar phosphate isomerase/epimerase family protein [Luteitalea sp.]|nr:sugar phosphate isomerase/epimerase family protein [Luteitalea sp.]